MTQDDATTRRTFIAGTTAALTTAIAGCSSGDADNQPDNAGSDSQGTSTPGDASETPSETGANLAIGGNQQGGGSYLYIPQATADVAFYIDVHHENGDTASETFEAGETVEEYFLELDPKLTENTDVRVAVHADDGGEELAGKDITYTYLDPTSSGAVIDISDQTGDGTSLTIPAAEAGIHYYVDVHYSAGASQSEFIPGLEQINQYEIELDPAIESDQEVRVAVHSSATGDELEGVDIQYTVE